MAKEDKRQLEEKKEKIQLLGLTAIEDLFKIDLSKVPKDTIAFIHNKAKIGMQFEREMNLSKRAIEMNYIRVFRIVAEDKAELKELMRESLPQYLK